MKKACPRLQSGALFGRRLYSEKCLALLVSSLHRSGNGTVWCVHCDSYRCFITRSLHTHQECGLTVCLCLPHRKLSFRETDACHFPWQVQACGPHMCRSRHCARKHTYSACVYLKLAVCALCRAHFASRPRKRSACSTRKDRCFAPFR